MRLELRSVTAGYGESTALRDVSLLVPGGTVVALLGPNGAGKTTLLRAASGMIPVKRGRVILDGEDLTGASTDRFARRGLCHVTEGRSIFPGLTVRDNLRMFSPKTEAGAIARCLDAFPDLAQRLDQPAGTLSGGQQQMLALSRAYAQRADVVLLDEVSLGLAPIIVDEIFLFLAELRAQGSSLLLVEQYVAKALAIATHVYILNRGSVAFCGEVAELAGTDLLSQYLGAGAGAT